MEKSSLKSRFILPPNVKGRCRGRLALCLHEIKWQCEEPFQFNSIQAKFIWWGDKTGATIKLNNKKHLKKSFGHVIQYNILTKPTLFRNYLVSAENFEIKFSSCISNVDIGKAFISIPIELIESTQLKEKSNKFRKKYQIFNAFNKIIGELLIEFDMQLYDRVLNEDEMNNILPEPENIGIENDMNQSNLEVDCDRKHLPKKMHKKKTKSKSPKKEEKLIENIPNKELPKKSTISTSFLNYLTGRPLDKAEENEAVKAIESTSPTESLIDLLSYDLNGLYLPKKSNNDEMEVLKKIDCLRIQVHSLCLTRAGIREILSKNESAFTSGTFNVTIDLDSILSTKSPFEKNNVFFSKITRIFSSSIETLPLSIEFNQSSVDKLNTFCIKSRQSYANGIITLRIHYRDIESSESRILGFSRIQLADIVQATNLTYQKQCPVTTTSSEIIVGRLSVKIELGCRGLHFGADFLDAISTNASDGHVHANDYIPYTHFNPRLEEDRENFHSQRCYECFESEYTMNNLFSDTCVYDIHDEPTDEKSGTPSTPLNTDPHANNVQMSNSKQIQSTTNDVPGKNLNHGLSKMDELSDDNDIKLNGLFHIGQIDFCSWHQPSADTFLVCRPFWCDSALTTENCPNKAKEENPPLNYLELFSVICNQKFLESTKHAFMSIEIWQRNTNQINILIGSAKVPLHQFFIAFNNNSIRNHVSQQELPVISIDGWISIAYANAPNSTPVGTVQAILAVGTTQQINHFKRFKNLAACKNFSKHPLELYPVQGNQSLPNSTPIESNRSSNYDSLPQLNDRSSNLASMLSNFIDTLAARLPDRNLTVTETPTKKDAATQANKNGDNNVVSDKNASGKYMRPTSELLDELQKALSIAPTPAQRNAIQQAVLPPIEQIAQHVDNKITSEPKNQTMFRVHIEIESALHLPSMSIHVNKRSGKRNKNNDSGKMSEATEPSTFATFSAVPSSNGSMMSYVTNIVENNCSPQWNKQFEVFLPVEFLHDDEKRFVIHVNRSIMPSKSKANSKPNSSNDVTIGRATIDLSVLMAGLPTISGWFNIIDHSGCINGQIKVHIKPKDDLTIYQKQFKPKQMINPSNVKAPETEKENEMPAGIRDQAVEVTSDCRTIDESALSRALKRKFTELEEISQRLRARLFDVTGDMTVDPDDEFENDLNTIPDEEDDFEESNIASEMSLDWLQHCQNQASSNEPSILQTSIAAQMQEIFEFLSPNHGPNQTTSSIDSEVESLSVDILNNQLNSHYNDVLNNENTCNENKVDDEDNTVKNISESLEKSLLKD